MDRKCSVDGCEERHMGLGYCGKHYHRYKGGSLNNLG